MDPVPAEQAPSRWWILNAVNYLLDLPITSIVRYVWKKDPVVLCTVIGSKWIVPPLVELVAPWWLAPQQIMSEFTAMQQDMNQQLGAWDVSSIPMFAFYQMIVLSLYSSSIRTCTRYWSGMINLRLQLLMRRLVMERVLYSEIGSLQRVYFPTLGHPVDARKLERSVMRDVRGSINVLFEQIPSALTQLTRLCRNGHRLWTAPNADPLLFAFPFLYQFAREMVGALTTWNVADRLSTEQNAAKRAMGTLMQNTVDQLMELQLMNCGQAQLDALDQLMARYFASRYSRSALLTEWVDDVRNHSVFRWFLESAIEIRLRRRWLLEAAPISHREYVRIRSQCNALFNCLGTL